MCTALQRKAGIYCVFAQEWKGGRKKRTEKMKEGEMKEGGDKGGRN